MEKTLPPRHVGGSVPPQRRLENGRRFDNGGVRQLCSNIRREKADSYLDHLGGEAFAEPLAPGRPSGFCSLEPS